MELNKEEIIQEYILQNYRLFPVSGKTPLIKNWTKKPFTSQIDKRCFSGNFGIALQPDDLIIDIDPKNFKENDNPHQRLCKLFPEIKESLIVQTGSGGLHIYLKKPADFKTKKHHLYFPGIDFLSKGSFAVGAGSIHPETKKEYKIVKGNFNRIISAPAKLLEMLKPVLLEFEDKGIEFDDSEQNQTRFDAWLHSAPIAIAGQNGNDVTFKIACRGRAFGLSSGATFGSMVIVWNSKCQPPWNDKELETIVQNAYRYNEEPVGKHHPNSDFEVVKDPQDSKPKKLIWHLTKQNDWKVNSIHNISNFFTGYEQSSELHSLLRFNLLSQNIEFTRKPYWVNKHEVLTAWDDNDALAVVKFLSTKLSFNVNKNLVHDAALAIAQENKYHPIIDYLESLVWDGTKRVANWLPIYLKTKDSIYERAVGELLLVAAIKRIYQAGCKYKNIVIIEGDQTAGKSPVCEILGGKWYADMTLNVNSPDTVDAMRSKWIVEVSEMECVRRAETQALKAFLSRQVDVCRLAYARAAKEFPRHTIFIGTHNPDNSGGYLKDMTGNTRYLPVLVPEGKLIDIKGLTQDRDQLWAEALQIYKTNPKVELYLKDRKLINIAEKETSMRRADDPWIGRISEWLDNPAGVASEFSSENYSPKFFAKADEIFIHALGGDVKNLGRVEFTRISNVMQDLGWGRSKTYRDGKETFRGYKRPEKNLVDLL